MLNASPLNEKQQLLIQASDPDIATGLQQLGFKSVPDFPQLLYLPVMRRELERIFQAIGELASATSTANSRYILLKSSSRLSEDLELTPQVLLTEVLQAKPLSIMTQALQNAWFLHVLEQQSLDMAYQPIFELQSGQVAAYECLARARDEKGEIYTGEQLLRAAQSTNLVYEFDQLARDTCLLAISTLASNQTFFINVLPNAILHQPKVFEQNCQQLVELGLKPQQVVWEFTEVEVLAHRHHLMPIIERTRSWGFRIAVDDLYSTSATPDHYVMEVCPDFLKLDRHLIQGCNRHPLKQVLIRSFLESAHALKIQVVAEGLECAEDIAFCQFLGIDFAQGYGLAMPTMDLVF